jgi:hypothetical protein
MNPYRDILQKLASEGVEFIIGGGVACVLHGVERVTMDVDIAVHMKPANLERFIDVMTSLGLKPRVPVTPYVLSDPNFVKMMIEEKHALVFSFLDPDQPIRHVDVFLRADLGYESLLPDSEWVDMNGYGVRIINRARLLAIKRAIQPPRAKDMLDIEFLSRE